MLIGMLIGNYNFNYKFFKKKMIVYFSDTPMRLLNIYNLKKKISEEEFIILKEHFETLKTNFTFELKKIKKL